MRKFRPSRYASQRGKPRILYGENHVFKTGKTPLTGWVIIGHIGAAYKKFVKTLTPISMAIEVEAFKFLFKADDMRALLDTGITQVVCVVSIEEAVTEEGKKVGALKIIGRGPQGEANLGAGQIMGCPIPPCPEN
jgi:hypothetical protein